MISHWFIYWFTRIDHVIKFLNGIHTISILLTVIGTAGLIAGLISKGFFSDDPACVSDYKIGCGLLDYGKKLVKYAFPTSLLIASLLVFIPNQKEVAAIYVIPKIANSEKVQDVCSDMVDLARDWMKELHPSNLKESINKNGKEK